MEKWGPVMKIFMKCCCPETEASHYFNSNNNNNNNNTSLTINSFISLLSKPTDIILFHSYSASSLPNRVMWIQTLPNAVQSRILSFLAVEYRKFCSRDLITLANNILSEGEGLDFWVKKSAEQLLAKMSQSNYEWVSGLNLDSEEESFENEFDSLPNWLMDNARTNTPLLPWLPLTREELNYRMPINSVEDDDTPMIEVEEVEQESSNYDTMETDTIDGALTAEMEEQVARLKAQMLNLKSAAETVGLANEIRQLWLERGGDYLKILGLIEPWKADDETVSILISNLSDGNDEELGWPSHVLGLILLPKLLLLEEPASRVLMTAMVEYCKVHQRATSNSLLYPLVLRKEGMNKAIGDVITRIIKECLHPVHVSAFCQKLLCGEEGGKKKFMCLPCYQSLISHELVWNEQLFSLFQNILNHNVRLTHDTVDQLVSRVLESVEEFSKSLKFGNFLLCLVNKCASLLKSHKLSLTEAVERTDTLVTKSILSKLATL